ncbi:hypothetical protein GTY66_10155 [Streptomyces sp. SID8356]|uniref:hypothetical protein n=1 Tax=unclassified Streptomyces TaxID=2593676 RepID=UPI000475FEA0|nr:MULTISPECIES: hypothetical protein [unclassified Streptomyces]MYT36417.1 hypothetical protein [Streptomyces sp. SID8356]
MRQQAVRPALVGGVVLLVLLLLLAACGGSPDGGRDDGHGAGGRTEVSGAAPHPAGRVARSAGPVTRLTVPPQYTTDRGWEVIGASPEVAVSHATGRLAYLERTEGHRYRLRTIDTATGEPGWSGRASRPPDPPHYPRLATVTAQDRQYFVTWSYGKAGDGMTPASTFVALDLYDVTNGSQRRVEVPWSGAPGVSTSGPEIVISDGRANSTLVDPVTGAVSAVGAGRLKYPKGCPACKQLTEVYGQTAAGLLVGGAREFWVRGGWFSRNVAPGGTDRADGVVTSVAPGRVLARWALERKAERAATHALWAVHDTATGRVLASVECHRPAIEPRRHPQAVLSPSGDHLVAGNLAFDLEAGRGRCFEGADGVGRLSLATVTDDGIAYGAENARDAADALSGGGLPVAVDLTGWTVSRLSRNARLPGAEATGVGVFRWTDRQDRTHLIGYPRTD